MAGIDSCATLDGVIRRLARWTRAVGFTFAVAWAFAGSFFGWSEPVNETQCVRSEEAAVCVDRRGTELEVRAEGLRPDSAVSFASHRLPAGADGSIEGRWFFRTNGHTLRGSIHIEARAASGGGFAGTIDLLWLTR